MTATLPLDHALAFFLGMVRLLGLFLVAPVFSHSALPMRMRIGLAFAVAWVAAPGWALPPESDILAAPLLASWVVREALIGVTLGFATSLVFSGLALMGEFASVQGGLGAATVLDPASGASSVVLTSLMQLFALLIFLAIDGHHELIRAVNLSFERMPVGGAGLAADRFAAVASMGSIVFEVAVRIAAPVTAVMILSNMAVGMLGRAIPQLNLMALQLPLHVGLTLLIIGLAAGPLTDAMSGFMKRSTDTAVAAVLGTG